MRGGASLPWPRAASRSHLSGFVVCYPRMTPDTSVARAFLVGVERKGASKSWSIHDSLEELGMLALTAGVEVIGSGYQKLVHPDPSTFIGSGKVEELRDAISSENANCAIFDGELSPGQQRKLEKALGGHVRVIDRTRLILDIFSRRAHSREGKLQVELAQYQYLLPRLAGMRADLEQQVGGSTAGPVGLRGPGETQLELDRRRVRVRIQKLKRDLEEVRTRRSGRGKRRERAGIPVISLVGYTNAGKSSILNALTGAGVLVEDRLFATLDPTSRRLRLPGGRIAVITDTVGFIRRLPHDLVAAFRATLEGVREASLILHVVDAHHPRALDHLTAVESVLTDLGAIDTAHCVEQDRSPERRGKAAPPLSFTPRVGLDQREDGQRARFASWKNGESSRGIHGRDRSGRPLRPLFHHLERV
jgi:GTP-binding protein HflX